MSIRQRIKDHFNHSSAASSPPVPTQSKPQHCQRRAVDNLDSEAHRPIPPYWRPDFAPSQPASTNFKHEVGGGGWGNNELQIYTDSPLNSFHTHQSQLLLRAVIDRSSPNPYTSARLTSHQRLSRPRGCLSARLTAPIAEGIWPAFWLLPYDPFKWPEDGEIDVMESWNGDRINHSCLHWGHFNGEDWDKHR
ncbi:hypothetical protein LTS18_001014, partial [Coniosporium uncinatum]